MEETKCIQEALACLPREELRRMLTEELHKETSNMDEALVRLLLAELKNWGTDPAFTDDDAVEAACEKFRVDTERAQMPRKRRYQSRIVKAASVILVLVCLFFGLPAAVQADPVPDVLGWWSDSVFQLLVPGEKPNVREYVFSTEHPGLQQIYDTVTELGITEQIVPRKLSKEYELAELDTFQMLGDTLLYARLVNNDKELLFTIIIHDEKVMLQYEKDTENVSVWDLAGVEHYVLSNNAFSISV